MDRFWGTVRRRLKGKPRTSPLKTTVGKDQESSISKTSLSRLERLSDDLLLDIIELVATPRTNFPGHPSQLCQGSWYLQGWPDTIDIYSLMRCNRHMYVLGEPILYRNFVESTPYRLPRFIRTIIWRPHLAEYVRNVKFKDRTTIDITALLGVLRPTDRARIEFLIMSRIIPDNTDPDKFEQSEPAKDQPTETTSSITSFRSRPDVYQILSSKKFGDIGNFEKGLQTEYCMFMPGFVLSLLPNIEQFHVSISREVGQPGQSADGLAYVFLRAAEFRYRSTTSPSPKPLSRLRDLTVSFDNRRRCPGIWHLFPYLAHHTLQSFTGDLIRSQYLDSDEYWSLLPPELRLKSLRLERSNIHTQTLHKLLQLCPVLEVFKYEHEQSRGEVIFEPKKFASSIKHLKPCLRKLELYRPGKYYESTACIAEEVTTISLSGFEKLTSLSITANLLLGALMSPKISTNSTIYQTSHQWQPPPPEQKLTQCLPRSLERLCLKECGEGIEEDVSELVEQATTLTPNLKTLMLVYEIIQPRDDFGNSRRLGMNRSAAKKWEEDCIAKGIKLDVLYGGGISGDYFTFPQLTG